MRRRVTRPELPRFRTGVPQLVGVVTVSVRRPKTIAPSLRNSSRKRLPSKPEHHELPLTRTTRWVTTVLAAACIDTQQERENNMIIWGRKTVRTPLGYAADYCPICAGAEPFAITRLGSAGHLYFVSVGEGDLLGYTRTCMTCSIELDADPSRYASLSQVPMALSALRQATHPNLDEVYRDQLELDSQLRFNLKSLTAEERMALIIRPFMLLATRVSARFAKTSFDLGGAFMKGEILPILVRGLQRFRPTAQELDLALQKMRQRRELIADKLPRDALVAAFAAAPSVSLATPGATRAAIWTPHYKAVSSIHQRRAGGLLRGLGYLLGAAVVVGVLSGLRQSMSDVDRMDGAMLWLGLTALAFGLFLAGRAVTEGKDWGRKVGMVYAVLMLVTFPIGTIVGLYLLWCLALRWPKPMVELSSDQFSPPTAS